MQETLGLIFRSTAAAFLVGLTSACSSIAVYGTDGTLQAKEHLFGMVDVSLPQARGAVAVSRRDVGLAVRRSGLTLGYSNELVVRVLDPSVCQAVIVVADPRDAREAHAALARVKGRSEGLCVIQTREETHP